KMGAIIAGASDTDAEALYSFGRNLGVAFQLQDDYLDAFGDPETFGKQIGGDIIENKKTILYLKAVDSATIKDRQVLTDLFAGKPENPKEKIERVKDIFLKSGSVDYLKRSIADYTEKAFADLAQISVSGEKKEVLRKFGEKLMGRTI
ncbi:MAG: polyprenyl synthetase family protein, partial [Bacteroidota bacterium]